MKYECLNYEFLKCQRLCFCFKFHFYLEVQLKIKAPKVHTLRIFDAECLNETHISVQINTCPSCKIQLKKLICLEFFIKRIGMKKKKKTKLVIF